MERSGYMCPEMEFDLSSLMRLSKLSLSPEEEEGLCEDLQRMVEFAKELRDEGAIEEDLPPKLLPQMQLREDRALPFHSGKKELFSNTPEIRDGFVFVPKAVDTKGDGV